MTDITAFSTAHEAHVAAMAARKSGDLATAVSIYRALPQAFPSKETVALVASGLRACGHWREAVVLLEQTVAEHSVSTGLVIALADAYVEMRQFPRAVAEVEKYLEQIPHDPRMWVYLGSLRGSAGDWADAEKAFAHALTLDPLSFDAVVAHGDALYQLGRVGEAVAAYRRAIVLKPEDAAGHFKLGSLLAEGVDLGEAKTVLFRAIALDPANAAAHANLAALYQRVGRPQLAILSARTAIERDAGMVAAYSVLGAVLLETGDIANAVQILRIAADIAPGSVNILIALATAENAANETRAAERTLQRILGIEPDNLEARHMLSAVNGEPVKTVPAGYSRQLFNWYASKFDHALAGSLGYRAPEEATELLFQHVPDAKAFKRFADLGCGTGLAAEALAKRYAFDRKVGVDVSEKMIEMARAKGVYDELVHGDAGAFLGNHPGAFDLITAMDVFIYVGDLSGLMPQIAAALAPGGVLAYSIERLPEGKYRLQRTGRFGHTQKYVEDLGAAHGLVPLAARPVTLRMEMNAGVPGLIGLLRRA